MFINLLKLFLRSAQKQLYFTILNVGGLAIGIASAFVILVYVIQESSYEKHFQNHENIYRVATKFMTMGEFAKGPEVLLEVAPEELPWIEIACRADVTELDIFKDDFSITEYGLAVEENFFEIFQYEFLSGSRDFALEGLNSIVLNKELAEKIFGNEPAIGEMIEIGEGRDQFMVTGIIDVGSKRSHLNAPFWINEDTRSSNAQASGFNSNWLSVSYYNYIQVKEGTDLSTVQKGLDRLVEEKVFPGSGSTLSFEEWFRRDDSYRLMAQPIRDIYLKGTLRFDLTTGGNEATVKTLFAIAFLILFIASINFINLSTARATSRSKEVGIKKMLGTQRKILALQFISESVLLSLFAALAAVGLAELALIIFEQITGQVLLEDPVMSLFNILFILLIAVLVGILAGLYPALYISSFKPSAVLKGEFHSIKSNTGFRNLLVVFQFSLSIILIVSSMIMFRQLNFMRTVDKGFNEEDVIIIDNSRVLGDKMKNFKDVLSSRSEVQSITIGNRLPGSTSSFSITSLRSDSLQEPVKINRFRGDADFLPTLGFNLIDGRIFSPDIASDTNAVILNESAARSLYLQNPVGTVLHDDIRVIGVIQDFHFESMRKKISPAVITLGEEWGKIIIRVTRNQAPQLISFLEEQWNSYLPEEPIRYHFLDENFEDLMKNDLKMSQVVTIFTVLAILISCLGLFGLSAYVANQRRKEIGIRKVMGASVSHILLMLNTNFLKLVAIAALIAIPVSVFLMRLWLFEFEYRTEITASIFIFAGVLTILIALMSVSLQSLTAATVNPVQSLKEE